MISASGLDSRLQRANSRSRVLSRKRRLKSPVNPSWLACSSRPLRKASISSRLVCKVALACSKSRSRKRKRSRTSRSCTLRAKVMLPTAST